MIKKALDLIREKRIDEGRVILTEKLSARCVSAIMAKIRISNRNEALSIFYDSLLLFIDKISDNKFNYENDEKLVSYFKTICINKAKEYSRYIRKGYLVSSESIGENLNDFNELFTDTRDEVYNDKLKEGFDIKTDEIENDFPVEVIREFHNLNEKCKFLIILKYKLKLKHEEIVEALAPFFKIKNREVSKAELQRCMQYLRSKVDISLKMPII